MKPEERKKSGHANEYRSGCERTGKERSNFISAPSLPVDYFGIAGTIGLRAWRWRPAMKCS
ncbi:MAG: hypothetical protein Q6365_025535 [Candidatus Sigynarchaeota archaeon]